MWYCLAHPTEGYYTKPQHEVLGAHGDFITSPEISQIFGEVSGYLSYVGQGDDEHVALARRHLAPFPVVGNRQGITSARS